MADDGNLPLSSLPLPGGADDFAAPFVLGLGPVRGRVVRLGGLTIDPILRRHDYPEAVSRLVGEAVALAALIGSAMKSTGGRVIIQAEGNGPVGFVVAEYRDGGGVRGTAKVNAKSLAALTADHPHRLPPRALLGEGFFAMTIDQGEHSERYQGVAPLDGDSLSDCAEYYFMQSEQTPTKIKLALAEVTDLAGNSQWRAGGLLIQRVAEDDARGDAEGAWEEAQALFISTGDDELVDPTLGAERLLFRLFHEGGVGMGVSIPLTECCTCDEGRLRAVLGQLSLGEIEDMQDEAGQLAAKCEFCGRGYMIDPATLTKS